MFHKYFNPVKKLFAFRFAFLAEVSVFVLNSLVHIVVPTDTPVAGCRWEIPFHFLQFDKKLGDNIAVVLSVVTPPVPFHFVALPLRGLLGEAKASFVATDANTPRRRPLKEGEFFKQ